MGGGSRGREVARALLSSGASLDDSLFESVASAVIERKTASLTNRCSRCWHDKQQLCICSKLTPTHLHLNVRLLVLMHYKEYLGAGDDAKLLAMMLPPSQTCLFLYGRAEDWEALAKELAVDPLHTLVLWPGEGALTVEEYMERLPEESAWRLSKRQPQQSSQAESVGTPVQPAALGERHGARHGARCECGCVPEGLSLLDMARLRRERRRAAVLADDQAGEAAKQCALAAQSPLPLLRVLLLDGVYNHARGMLRALHRRLPASHVPPHVALHPTTLSVYHRAAGKSYAASSAETVKSGVTGDTEAMRVCTVEAAALLLQELGEPETTTRALVAAVVTNNEALPTYDCEERRENNRRKREQWEQ